MANIIALSTPYPPTQNLPFHHHTYLTARLIFPSKMAPNNPGNPNNPTDPAPVEVDTQARNLKAKTIPLDPFLTGLDSRSPRVTLPTVTNCKSEPSSHCYYTIIITRAPLTWYIDQPILLPWHLPSWTTDTRTADGIMAFEMGVSMYTILQLWQQD